MATRNRFYNGFSSAITLVFLFLNANWAFAKTMTFEEGYTYQASEYDSKVSCRALALEQAKRLVLEKLGTYLESETEVKNFQLSKDQIVMLTAGIVSAEIIDENWNGKTYYLKAKITADPDDVATLIEKLRHDRQKTNELEEARKKTNEALQEVERLKKELETTKPGKIEQDQYKKAINGLNAIDWINNGIALGIAGKHQEALEAFVKAIDLDPKYSWAYMNRGIAHANLGDHRQAIRDYDRAIDLDPNIALAYMNRGIAYGNLGDHPQAIKNFDRAIVLDFKLAMAYYSRGIAYGNLGNHQQALWNYDRAIELDPKYGWAYLNRGLAYGSLGDHRMALRNFDRAIELDPKIATAYHYRGVAYQNLGDQRQAIHNYVTAARMGFIPAQDVLRSMRIGW